MQPSACSLLAADVKSEMAGMKTKSGELNPPLW